MPVTLIARKEPYALTVSPGEHTIYFDDPKRAFRIKYFSIVKKLTFGLLGAGMGLEAGGLSGAAIGANIFAGGQKAQIRENILLCSLTDGDELISALKLLFLFSL